MLLHWQRHLPQHPAADVRVHLRGAATGVPSNLLNDPQVSSSSDHDVLRWVIGC